MFDIVLDDVGILQALDLFLLLVPAADLEDAFRDLEVAAFRRRCDRPRLRHERQEHRLAKIAEIGRRLRDRIRKIRVIQIDLIDLAQRGGAMGVAAQNVDEPSLFEINHQVGDCIAARIEVARQIGVVRLERYALSGTNIIKLHYT